MTIVREVHDYLAAESEMTGGIPGIQLSVRAVRGRSASRPYGGFHDQLRLLDGRWGIAVGDVQAQSPASDEPVAAGKKMARAVLRAMAMTGLPPGAVLAGMNRALLAWSRDEQCCLAVAYADIELAWRGVRVRLCVAGGPTAFVRRTRGRVRAAGQPGHYLGLGPDAQLADAQITLRPGDSMLLVAPEVLKAVGGADQICEILACSGGGSAARSTDAVLAAVRESGGGQVAQEAVVLALKVPLRKRNAGTHSAGWPGRPRYSGR